MGAQAPIQQNIMFSNLDINGIVILSIGLLIRFWVGKRRFNRKNLPGLQVFPSYLSSQIIPFFEWFCNLIGLLLISLGAITLFM